MYNVLCISIPTYILKTKKENFIKNSKKILLFAVIVTLFTLLFALGASAEDVATSGSCGEKTTWSFDSTTGKLTIGGTGDMVDFGAVTDQPWNAYASSITSVEIADTVTTVGNRAFGSLSKLTACVVPDAATKIGYGAFSACSSLESIVIGNSVTEIGTYAFSGCTKLKEVHIPGSVVTIQNYAFQSCTSMTSVTFEEGVQSIRHGAFNACKALTEVVLPYSLKTFGVAGSDGVFKGCTNLEKVTFLSAHATIATPKEKTLHVPEGATVYGFENSTAQNYFTTAETGVTFTKIPGLAGGQVGTSTMTWSFDESTGTLTIGGSGNMPSCSSTYSNKQRPWDPYNVKKVVITKGITSVSNSAFRNIATIEEVILPEGITLIDNSAFKSCTALIKINLPESLTKMNYQAFNVCSSLKSIIIPKNVSNIGNGVFGSCSSLTAVIFMADSDKSITFGDSNSFGSTLTACVFCNNNASVIAHTAVSTKMTCYDTLTPGGNANADGSVTWKFNVLSGVMTISGTGAMDDFASTTAAAESGWYAHRLLVKKLVVEEGVTSLAAYGFINHTNLQTVSFPSTLTNIGKYAFSVCSSLDNLTIADDVTLNDSCFNSCTSLKTLVLEEGRTSITARVFAGCTALEEVVLPSTLKTFGYNVTAPFNGCTGLKTITFLNKDVTIYPATDKFAANTKTALPAGVTLKAYAGGMVEQYANENGYTFTALKPPFADDCTTAFEFTVGVLKAEAGQLLPLVSLERMPLAGDTLTNNFLAVDENGALFAYVNGKAEALYDKDGNAILLADETKISIVYNDKNGTARVYVNGYVPFYGETLEAVAKVTAASEAFTALKSISDNLVLAGGVVCDNHFTSEDMAAEFAGFQVSADTKSIRILAGINSLYYDSLGFTVELYSNGVLQGTRTEYTSVVFSSFLADGKTVTAEELGHNYMTALKIENIDRSIYTADANVYFVVKTFSVLGDEIFGGDEKRIYVYCESDGTHTYSNYKRAYTGDDEFVPVLSFVASSDIHVNTSITSGGPQKLTDAINQLLGQNYTIDALVLAGDITNNGYNAEDAANDPDNKKKDQYGLTKQWIEPIAAKKVNNGETTTNTIQIVATMGNHDYGNSNSVTLEQVPEYEARFEEAFGFAPTRSVVINGYYFITITCDEKLDGAGDNGANMKRPYGYDYSAETIAEAEKLIAEAYAADPERPIFVIQHVPTSDTVLYSHENYETAEGKVGKADTSDSGIPTLMDLQKKYSNLVIFAGHSHAPANDVASVHQEYFTAINTGVLGGSASHTKVDGVSLKDMANPKESVYDPNVSYTGGENDDVYYIEVDAHNRVKIRVWDATEGKFIGATFLIDSFDPDLFKYTEDRYTNDDIFFTEDAAVTVKETTSTTVTVEFPSVPAESLAARVYKLVATDAEGNEVVGYVVSAYQVGDRETPITMTLSGLKSNTEYTLNIYAMNPLYSNDIADEGTICSEPITITFSTKAE